MIISKKFKQSKVVLLFACLFLVFGCTNSNDFSNDKPVNDSINFYLERSGNFDLSESERLLFAKKAYRLINNQKTDSLNFVNRYYVAFDYFNLKKFDDYKSIISLTLDLAIEKQDSMNMGRSYYYLGDYYYQINKNDSAYYYFYHAEKLFFKLKKNRLIGKSYIKKAQTQIKEKDYLGSEKSAITALNYSRVESDKVLEYDAYNILGLSCLEIKDFEKSLDYFNKMLKIANEVNIEEYYQTKALALLNIGKVNQRKGNHYEALNYFQKAIKEPNLYKEAPNLYGSILDELTYSKFKSGKLENTPDDFYKALKIHKTSNNIPSIFGCKIHLSEYYERVGKLDSAQKYANLAYQLSKESKIINLQLKALNQLTDVFPEKANTFSKEYLILNDSVMKMERRVTEKFARIEFETDEIILEKEKAVKEREQMLLILVLVMFSGGLLLIIFWQRNRQKQLVLINNQQKANEEIYQLILDQQIKFDEGREKEKKRIARELHDGVMNNLAGIRYNLFRLEKKRDDETIESCLNHISELHNVEKEIRNIAHDLNLEVFSPKNDYASLLNTLITENEYDGIYITLEVQKEIVWESVSSIIKMNCYRILQECFNNIKKHSQATEVNVQFQLVEEHLILEVSDNGLGFNLKKQNFGLGLSNIKERVKILKGTFDIYSEMNKFTTIKVNIPL